MFLDANVLFSAAYRRETPLTRLWRRRTARLLTSGYAAAEARLNLDSAEQAGRLERLLARVDVVPEAPANARLPEGISPVEKDRPILLAAIHAGASRLLTGDVSHFGPRMGRRAGGVLVLRPPACLRGDGSDPP